MYGCFPSRDAAVGAVSGIAAASVTLLVCHPLDTIMVRIQRQEGFRWTWRNLRRIGAHPYAGLPPHMVFYCSNGFVRFSVFAHVKGELQRRWPAERSPLWQLFVSGSCAGMATSFAVHPFLVLKTVMQANPESQRSLLGTARRLVDAEGAVGLYRAFPTGLLRNGWQIGIYFAAYERFKDLSEASVGGSPVLTVLSRSAAGGAAGATCWLAAMPTIVAFSRLAGDAPGLRSERSLLQALRAVVREDGVRGLWRGTTPAMLRAVPANAVLMPAVDQFRALADAWLP